MMDDIWIWIISNLDLIIPIVIGLIGFEIGNKFSRLKG